MNELIEQPIANRYVIVLDKDLPPGLLANASAVIALTIGQRHPGIVGEEWTDASGDQHPGLITTGVVMLGASQAELAAIRQRGVECECDVIDFPVEGQMTTNYQQFRETVAAISPAELSYLAVALVGQKKVVNKIVGKLELLK